VQPLFELAYTRPWHWGIAVLGKPKGSHPELNEAEVVSVGEDAIVISVRHAQDIEAERFEGDWDWVTVTFRLRALTEAEPVERTVVFDGVLATDDARLSLGDADGEIILPCPDRATRVVVSTDEVDRAGLDRVWVDLLPAESSE
jgi:hypothetical protein